MVCTEPAPVKERFVLGPASWEFGLTAGKEIF